jgi:hypothetical protein
MPTLYIPPPAGLFAVVDAALTELRTAPGEGDAITANAKEAS